MPFFDDGHLDGIEFSKGPTIGFFEGFDIGYDQQYEVDSFFSLEDELKDRWETNLAEYEKLTSRPATMATDLTAMSNYATAALGQETSVWGKRWKFDDGRIIELSEQERRTFQQVNDQIKALANPNVKSFEDILADVMEMRRKVEGRTAAVDETGSTGGAIGEFIGAIAGSFTLRDPLLLGTLPVGGFGRSVASRILSEAAIAGGVEAVQQYAKVQPTRQMLSEPERSPLFSVLAAAAGAGVIRGGFEGAGALLERFTKRTPEPDFNLRDDMMRQMFENSSADPSMRAGGEILDDVVTLERMSPYGSTPTGMAKFTGELEEVRGLLSGQTMTAVGRNLPEVSVDELARTVDFQIVKERSPQVYAKMEEARRAVAEIDSQAAEINSALEATTLADAVRLVDEDAADELMQIETRLREEIPEPEKAALTLRAEILLQRVGTERVAAKLSDAEIAPKKELQRLKSVRRAANKKLRASVRAVEVERENILRVERLYKDSLQGQASDILGQAIKGQPVLGSGLSHTFVASQSDTISRAASGIEDRAVGLLTPEDVPIILDGREIPDDFIVELDDGKFSAREIMRDLDEDVKLDEATRSCLV